MSRGEAAPLVSVIMPVYKTAKYLDSAVESVLAQTLADWELILVDDGSPDECGALCDAWARRDTRIKVLHKQNAGQGAARNAGLALARGEYISFVDSDDLLHERFFETLVEKLRGESLDFVRCGFARFFGDDPNNRRDDCNPALELRDSRAVEQLYMLPLVGASARSRAIVPTACTTLFRADIIKKDGIAFLSEREYQSEDLLFNLDYLARAQKGACVCEALYYYRDSAGSFTRASDPRLFERAVRLRGYLLEWGQVHGLARDADYTARVNARLLDQTSVYIKKTVEFERAGEARAAVAAAADNAEVRAALEGCEISALGFPLSLFCALLRRKRVRALCALIALYVKFASAR